MSLSTKEIIPYSELSRMSPLLGAVLSPKGSPVLTSTASKTLGSYLIFN